MVEYAQIECHDCFGIFPGNLMRRKSQSKAIGRSVQAGNPFDQDSMRHALETATTHYGHSEILLCPKCLSKRRLKKLVKFAVLAAIVGARIYWYTTRSETLSTIAEEPIVTSGRDSDFRSAELVVPSAAATQAGPSFRCSAATTTVEKLICGSEEISALDVKLAVAFRQKMKLEDRQSVLVGQRSFLSRRNQCTDEECLLSEYSHWFDRLTSEKDDHDLLDRWSDLNSTCRGRFGDDPLTNQACDDRDEISGSLEKSGWCLGEQDGWYKCN